MKDENGTAWWTTAVFYQIYPRSFQDADGDGVGDLAGIIQRLDYIVDLGADALWISPFFKSPMKDFGYDISDYCDVDPLFGSLKDFKRLLDEAHRRGIRIVIDLVVNHSSDEHPWFREARSSKDNPKHDWYLWKPITGRKPPNNWISLFEQRSAWYPNGATKEWYLGTFTRSQPEFNWRNRELREAIYGITRFWLDLGADGFRMDVATAYIKDDQYRSNPFKWNLSPDLFQEHIYDRNRPEVGQIFQEFRTLVDGYGDRVLIAETHGRDPALAASCHGQHDDGLHMAFNFEFLFRPWSAGAFRDSAERWYSLLPEGAWPNFTLSNHDQPRHWWRYRHRDQKITEARARVAAAMLLLLRGTPFLYYGEELGMDCRRIPRKDLRDPLGINTWPFQSYGRDPERTPMQWDASANAGFTSGKPWLPVNPDYPKKNVAAQRKDPDSLWNWYASLLRLRKAEPALVSGSLRFIDTPADVMAWERLYGDSRIAVYLNFGLRPLEVAVDGGNVLLRRGLEQGSDRNADQESSARAETGTGNSMDAIKAGAFVLSSLEVLVIKRG